MKYIILVFLLFIFNPSFASEEDFITTDVYKYSAKNGIPVFTDKEPKNKPHEVQTIEAVKSTGNSYTPAVKNSFYNAKIGKRSSKRKSNKKKKKKQIAICKKYKRQFKAVSEQMRIGYKASQYRKLEKKRVKYRDLLFYNCNSHELL